MLLSRNPISCLAACLTHQIFVIKQLGEVSDNRRQQLIVAVVLVDKDVSDSRSDCCPFGARRSVQASLQGADF